MKRIFKIVIAGICWGLLFLLAKVIFQIPYDVLWLYYLIISGTVFIGTILFNVCYNLYYQQKMKAAMQLYKANHMEEYVAQVESLRCRAKGRFTNALFSINLSAGYCELHRYDEAARLLESLSDTKLSGEFALVYRINLCLCYFYLGQTDRALALYEDSQKLFYSSRSSSLHERDIALLDIFAAIGIQDYDRAAVLLEMAERTWNDPGFLDAYRVLKEKIEKGRGILE